MFCAVEHHFKYKVILGPQVDHKTFSIKCGRSYSIEFKARNVSSQEELEERLLNRLHYEHGDDVPVRVKYLKHYRTN